MRTKSAQSIALASLLLTAAAGAQELYSVNLWNIGRPWASDSNPCAWVNTDGSPKPTNVATLTIENGETAGVRDTTAWQNIQVGSLAVGPTSPGVTINGSEGGTATFKIITKQSQSPYRDGVDNGLAFLLGAANPDDNALGLLPDVSENTGGLVLTFSVLNRDHRGPALATLQWSNDLGTADPWAGNSAPVPETTSVVNGVSFQVTPNGNLNDVIATIPSTETAAGRLFGRISGTEN
jgi:hypothetical protein